MVSVDSSIVKDHNIEKGDTLILQVLQVKKPTGELLTVSQPVEENALFRMESRDWNFAGIYRDFAEFARG